MSFLSRFISWCKSPQRIILMSHNKSAIIMVSTISLIATVLVLNIQFFFPPLNNNSSESQHGMKELWNLKLCEYPKPLSEYLTFISATIPVPDVNGDGINDIVAGAWDNNTYCLSGADGSILWKKDLGKGVRNVWAVPSQGEDDFNIVASTTTDDFNHNGETYLLNGRDGSEIWKFPKGSAILLVPDIDNDGVPEIVTQNKPRINAHGDEWEYTNISLLSGASGEEFWTSNVIGSSCLEIFGSRYEDPIGNLTSGIIACWYNVPELIDPNKPFLISFDIRSGKKLWSCQVFRPVSIVVASIMGEADVIVGAVNGSFLIDGEDGKVVWSRFLGSETVLEVDVTQDIDGDGVNDILVGSVSTVNFGSSKVRLFSGANGNILWEHILEPYFIELRTIQDLNKDGVMEVVVAAQWITSTSPENYVYILNGFNGKVLGKYVIPDSRSVNDLTVIPDVNGDGLQDIIITTQSSVSDKDRYYWIFLLAPDPSEFQEQGSG